MRLRWHYGDQLRMGNADDRADARAGRGRAARRGSAEPAAELRHADRPGALRADRVLGAGVPRRRRGTSPRARHATSGCCGGCACASCSGGLLDDPELIAAAARRRRPRSGRARRWCAREEVEAELQADIAAARTPPPAARALDHKLGGPRSRAALHRAELRLMSTRVRPSCRASTRSRPTRSMIANLAPGARRRRKPEAGRGGARVAGEPLATAEVALIDSSTPARARGAQPRGDAARGRSRFYWTLSESPA